MEQINDGFVKTNGHRNGIKAGVAVGAMGKQDHWLADSHDADGRPRRRNVSNGLLARMPSDIYKRLRPFLKEVALEKDEYLYQQDDQIDSVYFPESGVISEFQILEDGRTIEVAITGPEGAVGISSAFSMSTATSCTQVCVPGSVWKIKSEILEREIAVDSELNRLLHDQINSNIRQLSQKIICNTYHSLEQRFCTWLLSMTERCGTNRLHVTQEQVARALGVHRPSVTYIAQALRDLKLIDYRRGRITITDRTGVKEHACPCYTESSVERSAVFPSNSWSSRVKH